MRLLLQPYAITNSRILRIRWFWCAPPFVILEFKPQTLPRKSDWKQEDFLKVVGSKNKEILRNTWYLFLLELIVTPEGLKIGQKLWHSDWKGACEAQVFAYGKFASWANRKRGFWGLLPIHCGAASVFELGKDNIKILGRIFNPKNRLRWALFTSIKFQGPHDIWWMIKNSTPLGAWRMFSDYLRWSGSLLLL
jgi:hypothetical protein